MDRSRVRGAAAAHRAARAAMGPDRRLDAAVAPRARGEAHARALATGKYAHYRT